MVNRDDRGLRIICVIWQNARKHESGIKAELSHSCAILHELELSWSRRMFRRHIQELFGINGWFESWNKTRRCGCGPFHVLVLEAKASNVECATTNSLRQIAGGSDAVYISLTNTETDRLARVLLGVGIERWLELVQMSAAEGLEVLGHGARRMAYGIPGTDLCLKSYLASSRRPIVTREVAAFRFNLDYNTSAQEGLYFHKLKKELPDALAAVFPKTLELVALPVHGWSLVEERIVNADGSAIEKFAPVYQAASPSLRAKLLAEFQKVMDGFMRYAVRFYDPQNILVQWLGKRGESDFRLRVVDFEPTTRSLIPLDSICPAFVRMKVRRRERRYLKAHVGLDLSTIGHEKKSI